MPSSSSSSLQTAVSFACNYCNTMWWMNKYIRTSVRCNEVENKSLAKPRIALTPSTLGWKILMDMIVHKICLLIQSVAMFLDCCIIFWMVTSYQDHYSLRMSFHLFVFIRVIFDVTIGEATWLRLSELLRQSEHLVHKVNLMKYEAK